MIMRVVFDYEEIESLLKDFKAIGKRIDSNTMKMDKEGLGEKRTELERVIKLDCEREKFVIGLLEGLTLKERMVLHIFYIEGRTWSEVTRVMEFGESRAKQIRVKAINQMVRMASI